MDLRYFKVIVLLVLSGCVFFARGETPPKPVYVEMRPDIIANYIQSPGQPLGYLRVAVSLLVVTDGVDPKQDLTDLTRHLPLLRDAIILIIRTKSAAQVKSTNGKQEIQSETLKRFNELLVQESKRKLIEQVIFTTYIYQ